MKLGLQIHKLVSQKSMFLGTLGASLLGKLLTGNGLKFKIPGRAVTRAGEGDIRAGQIF